MIVQGMMQQEQSSPHQQGSFTPGTLRLSEVFIVDDVAAEEDEDEVAEVAERAVGRDRLVDRAVDWGIFNSGCGSVCVGY